MRITELPDPKMAARLEAARIHAGHHSAAAAAKAMGIPYPTYAGHENGSRGFSKSVPRYANFYRVRLDWLLTGRGEMTADIVVDLFNRVPIEKQPEALDFMRFLAAGRK